MADLGWVGVKRRRDEDVFPVFLWSQILGCLSHLDPAVVGSFRQVCSRLRTIRAAWPTFIIRDERSRSIFYRLASRSAIRNLGLEGCDDDFPDISEVRARRLAVNVASKDPLCLPLNPACLNYLSASNSTCKVGFQLQNLDLCSNLTMLCLSPVTFAEARLHCSSLPSLEAIRFHFSNASEEEFQSFRLPPMPHLQSAQLSSVCRKVWGVDILFPVDGLELQPKLQVLDLSFCAVPSSLRCRELLFLNLTLHRTMTILSVLEVVSECPKLRQIRLSRPAFVATQPVPKQLKLCCSRLALSRCAEGEDLRFLPSLPDLNKLQVVGKFVLTETLVAQLSQLRRLETFMLDQASVDTSCDLSSLRFLRELALVNLGTHLQYGNQVLSMSWLQSLDLRLTSRPGELEAEVKKKFSLIIRL